MIVHVGEKKFRVRKGTSYWDLLAKAGVKTSRVDYIVADGCDVVGSNPVQEGEMVQVAYRDKETERERKLRMLRADLGRLGFLL